MLKQYARKKIKVLKGLVYTYALGLRSAYDASWWDEDFFTDEISDRQTIWSGMDPLASAYHYVSVELKILRYLHDYGVPVEGTSVVDFGPGAGHWIDFYLSLGAARAIGIELSAKATSFLQDKYGNEGRVRIKQGRISDVAPNLVDSADLVSAIGVMFHLVDDTEWRSAIDQAARILRPGGVFVVGGHFGWFDGVNVQYGRDRTVNKRLRSSGRWKRELHAAGFCKVVIQRNNAYLHIREDVPENNLLFAVRR